VVHCYGGKSSLTNFVLRCVIALYPSYLTCVGELLVQLQQGMNTVKYVRVVIVNVGMNVLVKEMEFCDCYH